MDDEDDIAHFLDQARKYRALGNATRDRETRLALLELAVEFEEQARRLSESRGPRSLHEDREPPPVPLGA